MQDALLHITDLHFWEIVRNPIRLLNKRFLGNLNVALRRSREFHTGRAAQTADALAATGVRTVFAGGDFTSTSTEREFAQAAAFLKTLSDRGLRVIAIPGNHDRYTFASARRRQFEKHFAAFVPARDYPCRVDLPGGTPFVIVPGARPNLISSAGQITDKDAEKTAELLAACPPGPVLVGAHYPLLHDTPEYHSGPSRRLRNAESLRRVLGVSGREILYVSGHVHRASFTRDQDYPLLRHVTTGALFFERPGSARRGMFTEIHVSPSGFDVQRHEYRDGWQPAQG